MWTYLYRALDRDGKLVDVRLRAHRALEGATQFLALGAPQAVATVGPAPERVTTEGQDSDPRASRETVGADGGHRTNPYLNNRRTRSSW